MAHICKCYYCGVSFDRDIKAIVYVPPKNANPDAKKLRFRYGHKECYLNAKEQGTETRDLEIFEPNDNSIQCYFCRKRLTEEEAKMLPNGQMACGECFEKDSKSEKSDKTILLEYLMKLFSTEYAPPNTIKQAEQYIKEYHFNYKGIYRALKYFFEVQGHAVDKDKPTIGIVPYMYQQAETYYYKIMLALEANKDKTADDYKPKEQVVKISAPRPQPLYKQRAQSEWWEDDD